MTFSTCVLDASLEQRQAGQTCSSTRWFQHHLGSVEPMPRGHQGQPSCWNCKDWACAFLEVTAHQQGISCCTRGGCGGGGGRWRFALRRWIVRASWAGSACRPRPDRRPGCWTLGTSLPSRSGFCSHHCVCWVAVDDWSKYHQNALAKRGRKRKKIITRN